MDVLSSGSRSLKFRIVDCSPRGGVSSVIELILLTHMHARAQVCTYIISER